MASFPDIVVTSTESPRILIAVETKIYRTPDKAAFQQIRHYMAKMSCPVGLLVSPEELYIFRNRYTGNDATNVEEVGHYKVGKVFQEFANVPSDQSFGNKAFLFERFVQNWLERLPRGELERLPNELRDALETHVVPALEGGIVRAAGPREARSII